MKLFKLIPIILFFIASIISCQTTSKQKVLHQNKFHNINTRFQLTLPSWFIEKPQIPELNLVYAYCSQYRNETTEKYKLLLSAAKHIAKYKKVNLTILQNGKLRTGKYIGYTDILESDTAVNKNNLEKNITIIYQYSIGTGILAIAAETAQLKRAHLSLIKNTLCQIDVSSPPKWVNSLPKQTGFIFAVGFAQDHSSPEKAWKVAEKNARANLALQLNATLKDETIGIQRSMWEWMETNHQICSSMILTNVSIIKHGYCETNRTYYALARMKSD